MAQKEILTKKQRVLLKAVSQNKDICRSFYLTGGTALSEFYLKHRFSEDLDFFNEKEFNPQAIFVFLKSIKDKLGIKKIETEQSFNRYLFFVHLDKAIIKTEFTYFPFPRISKGLSKDELMIDSLLDIAVNKIFTIYQKARARDFIDLYFIHRQEGWTIRDLVKKAKVKFDWRIDLLQLGSQFLKSQEVKDYPVMIKKIEREEWQGFFIKEAKKLKKDIFV